MCVCFSRLAANEIRSFAATYTFVWALWFELGTVIWLNFVRTNIITMRINMQMQRNDNNVDCFDYLCECVFDLRVRSLIIMWSTRNWFIWPQFQFPQIDRIPGFVVVVLLPIFFQHWFLSIDTETLVTNQETHTHASVCMILGAIVKFAQCIRNQNEYSLSSIYMMNIKLNLRVNLLEYWWHSIGNFLRIKSIKNISFWDVDFATDYEIVHRINKLFMIRIGFESSINLKCELWNH